MQQENSWQGPFILNEHNIENKVNDDGLGVYILGDLNSNGELQIKHVHNTQSVKSELKKWLGKHDVFLYERVKSAVQGMVDRNAIAQLIGSFSN